jgi:hypothetical protein
MDAEERRLSARWSLMQEPDPTGGMIERQEVQGVRGRVWTDRRPSPWARLASPGCLRRLPCSSWSAGRTIHVVGRLRGPVVPGALRGVTRFRAPGGQDSDGARRRDEWTWKSGRGLGRPRSDRLAGRRDARPRRAHGTGYAPDDDRPRRCLASVPAPSRDLRRGPTAGHGGPAPIQDRSPGLVARAPHAAPDVSGRGPPSTRLQSP